MAETRSGELKQYFLAILPPGPVLDEAMKLKLYFRDKFNSKASLNSPPHITMHMPFRWKEKKEEAMIALFSQFAAQFDPFNVCLDNFGCFEPRVIYINVVASGALTHFHKSLERFCKRELNLFNANYREEPFHPHVTLAFRDLKKDAFKAAWQEFSIKEFKAEFMFETLTLLKHNGEQWEVFRGFQLASSSPDRDNTTRDN